MQVGINRLGSFDMKDRGDLACIKRLAQICSGSANRQRAAFFQIKQNGGLRHDNRKRVLPVNRIGQGQIVAVFGHLFELELKIHRRGDIDRKETTAKAACLCRWKINRAVAASQKAVRSCNAARQEEL